MHNTNSCGAVEYTANLGSDKLNNKIKWALYVNQDNELDKEIAYNAKYHCFNNNKSLCGKYSQDNDYFETDIESDEILKRPEIACKKCFNKWKKMFF